MRTELRVLEDGVKKAITKGDLVVERVFTKLLFEAYGIEWNKNISNLDEV